MKKIILTMSLFLSVFLFSETTNGNNLKQSINNAFYEFMDFHTKADNVRKNVMGNSLEGTNEILGTNVDKTRKDNLQKIAKSQTNASLSNSSDYLVIANSKITYKIKNTEVKNGEAVLNVYMKVPDLTAYNSELQNYIEKKVSENKKEVQKMNEKRYQSFLLEKISEFYLNVVKRNDLKFMESDIKVYVKKYPNKWGVIQDYKINNALYKYLGFGFGPELIN
ncbi:hypothetical protein [Leptotrichia sp. oral taxon 847]|uniref:hypothetical protein n=1 Tax=Leptotrichia sp. oral taxon 847 TaxID=1785996 RepID=UPI000768433F|nr:hypothetical protein [Leptotrichia sp. oral taxon 847]AMD94810.1 hypothetical protein AXF11_03865 [Leptotrichia sp. oral taxon 847]